VRQAERGLLADVGSADAERAAVAHRALDLRRGVTDYQPDVGDPGIRDRLQPVEQDRLVRDRDELLG
jgi:hypothetical protein